MRLTLSVRVSINFSQTALTPDAKQCTLFECQCIQHKDTNQGHYFYVPSWRPDHHVMWPSEPHKGLAVCKAQAVPSIHFSSINFQTLSYGTAPKIEPATSGSAVQSSALPTELILLWSLSTLFHTHPFIQNCPLNKLGPGKSKRYITSALSHTALPHCHKHNRKKVSLDKSFHIQADL